MSANETFGQMLKRFREEKEMTQQQLADLTGEGLSRVSIARIETDQNDPTWDTVKVICKALGVGCDQFMQTVPAKEKKNRIPPPPGPGRPRKPKEEGATPAGKRQRGRPRKEK